MNAVFSTIGPLLLVSLAGFAAARSRVMTLEQTLGLGRFIVTIALPAVLVSSLAQLNPARVLESAFLPSYLFIGAVCGSAVFFIGRRLLRQDRAAATTMTLGVWVPNNIIIGYPLALQLLGDPIVPMFVSAILVENVLWIPLALVLFERSGHTERLGIKTLVQIGRRVISNPIVLAATSGLVLAGTGVVLPDVLLQSLNLLGGAVTGAALFYVGATLGHAPPSRLSSAVACSVGARLLLAPLLSLVLIHVVTPLNPIEQAALLLFTATPSFSILPAMAAPYGGRDLGASIQVLGTALSAVTLTGLVIWLL